jgi:hypothetical protein
MLSLFSPAARDTIQWTAGDYQVSIRGGRVDSPAASGERKRDLRLLTEGSVVVSAAEPAGRAVDVAPPGHPHPVWRAGFALSLPIPYPGLTAGTGQPRSAG